MERQTRETEEERGEKRHGSGEEEGKGGGRMKEGEGLEV